MCGIAGIFGIRDRRVELREVQAMCDAIVHRGPNDEGYYIKDNVGIGMRRLSIIDLEGGHQPVHNEDGSVQVVLNGEIYNFATLRRDLEARGHRFYTHSDTEVIVHLYEEYGQDCVKHLRGMFAFALWDEKRRQLLLARDRLGIKPLFFGEFGGRLVFASELKALLQLPDVERELNWGALGHLFACLTTPREESIVAGVRKLLPGHTLSLRQGEAPQIRQYWDVAFESDHSLSEQDCVDGLRERLEESVRLRMIADVPLGAFLSGGIDSSAVVATMARLSSRPVKTFSIGFPEQEYDEARHAREVAKAFGTEHHELVLEPDVLDDIDDLAWYLDEPFGDSSAIPTYMVSKLAAEQVTVALSGDGGDELFAGYDKYVTEQRRRRQLRYVPDILRALMGAVGRRMPEGAKGRNFLRHMALDHSERYVQSNTLLGAEEQRSLLRGEVAEQVLAADPWRARVETLEGGRGDWLSRIQYQDLKNYLPLDILTKVDRMSMANSLEARVPLLDHKLVEFAAAIPPQYRLRGGSTKHIFKQAMRGILPDGIIDRRKQGFALPLDRWFRGELSTYVRDLLLSETSRARGIFDAAYIEKMLKIHDGGRSLYLPLWTLISFELWCRTFLDRSPVVDRRQAGRPLQWREPAAGGGIAMASGR